MNIKKWINENCSSLSHKVIAITGSTGVIAQSLVKSLAELNARFIFINRNKNKTNKQIKELKLLCPNVDIQFIQCDLTNFEDVKSTTETLKQLKIDVLFLSAGVYNVKRYKTELNFDNIFQSNFVSHYYIVKELLDNIKKINGKIIAVSSIAHNYSKIDENDIDFSTRKKHSKVYGNAKRFLTFSLMELCKKEKINLSIVHPGLTLTSMTNHYHRSVNWLVKLLIKIICPSVRKSCLSLIKGVFDSTDYHEWIGPRIFNIWGNPKKQKLKTCSEQESEKIFKITEKIYNNIKKSNID